MLLPSVHQAQKQSLINVLRSEGLLSNLKLCLDAGDKNSYDPAVQTAKWLDVSGNGYDFYRGTSSAGDGAEPTFNGTAGGLSSSEYWSFDGGDYFTYDNTNETWMQNIHKDNAIFTLGMWLRTNTAASSCALMGTKGASGPGFLLYQPGGGFNLWKFEINNGTSGNVPQFSNQSITATTWHFCAVSCNEATGALGAFTEVDGATSSYTSTYTSPSASSSSTMLIGSTGVTSDLAHASARIAAIVMWEGVALTTTQLISVYNRTRTRFGV